MLLALQSQNRFSTCRLHMHDDLTKPRHNGGLSTKQMKSRIFAKTIVVSRSDPPHSSRHLTYTVISTAEQQVVIFHNQSPFVNLQNHRHQV